MHHPYAADSVDNVPPRASLSAVLCTTVLVAEEPAFVGSPRSCAGGGRELPWHDGFGRAEGRGRRPDREKGTEKEKKVLVGLLSCRSGAWPQAPHVEEAQTLALLFHFF